jgi:hypothetical protein
MVERQRGKLLASAIEKLTAANHQAACAQSDQVRENCIDVSFGGGIQNIELKSEIPSGRLRTSYRVLGDSRIGGINEERDEPCLGNNLMQQFHPLRHSLYGQLGYTCGIAARPIKTGNKAELNGVATRFENDRNGRGRRLCSK